MDMLKLKRTIFERGNWEKLADYVREKDLNFWAPRTQNTCFFFL